MLEEKKLKGNSEERGRQADTRHAGPRCNGSSSRGIDECSQVTLPRKRYEKGEKTLKPQKLGCSTEEGGRHAFTRHVASRCRLQVGAQRSSCSNEGGDTSRNHEDGDTSRNHEAFSHRGRSAVCNRVGKDGKIPKRITWADEVGGELCRIHRGIDVVEGTLHVSGKGSFKESKEICIEEHQRGKNRGKSLPAG